MAHAARDLDLRAIVTFTDSAATARMLSKYRPAPRIYAFTPHEAVCHRMNLLWGVTPVHCPARLTVQGMGEFAEAELNRLGVVRDGDVFGLIAGTTQTAGATNFLRLMVAGAAPTKSA
jgi:pyruvate kinase